MIKFIFVTFKFSETVIMDDTSEKEKKSAEQNEKDQVKTAYGVLCLNCISNLIIINAKAYKQVNCVPGSHFHTFLNTCIYFDFHKYLCTQPIHSLEY